MPRPSLSRPPPITVPWQSRDSDVENEPPTAYNVRRQGPTNRKLFFTPTEKTPSSPSPTFLLTRDSITRRYYRQHDNDKTPVKTPLPRRPSNAPSTSRRPKITTLDATPSVNRTLQGSAPDRWRARQVTDLTAWLNHELSASSDAATLPMHHVASSVVFLNQFAQMNAIYRSKSVHNVLARLTNEICAGRLNVSKTIKLASFLKERDQLISLLLLNYHPHWLLLALSVVLGMNLAMELDEAVEKAGARGRTFNHEQVLTQALENSIRNEFLADAPSDNVASRGQASPDSQERDRYNALILRRTLVVIYLLDVAKRQRDPVIKPGPPLFRATSEMTSSVDVLRNLQQLLLNDHGDIVRFLSQRGYSVSYKSPVFEPFGNLSIVNLSEDMRDGTRLCKLASIMRRDHQILTQVIRVGPGHRPSTALAIKKQNITTALNSMKECLPPDLQNRFHWHGTPHDIATGNIDKTIAVLWQIAALWMEYVVVDNQKLKHELDIVKNEFRVARRNPDSPSNNVQIDLSSLADSPSKLQIIESCDTDSGDLLLMWCATLCGIYGVEIRDFTEDFRDGAVLCLILHHYCPDLMRIDEINRVPAGDYRGALAAEAEHKHVQKNLELFMDRCRLLGTIPEIFLSSEATLAPAFHDSLKQESVGRVMQLLASYLFRRMMMQKETSSARREAWEIMEKHKGTPEMEPSQEIDLVHETEPVPIRKTVLVDINQQQLPEHTEQEYSADANSSHLVMSDEAGNRNAPAKVDSRTSDVPDGNNSDLAHVYTRMRHVQSRRATRPRPSQLIVDRENAARVIWAHYQGYKARQEYYQLRNAVIDLQSSVRGYYARRDVNQRRSANTEELIKDVAAREPERVATTQAITRSESPVLQADRPPAVLDEETKSLPLRIGQQILEFIPAFRRHLFAMESYSQRMLAHEKMEAENQAATVIQSAARSHLARRTRTSVETQRQETRRTWMSCAAEAAKTALQMVENQRRELAKWHEQLITKAIHQAGNNFASEMSRLQTARKEADMHRQKLDELKASQEANFAAELHKQKVAFEEQMAETDKGIQTLESRAANFEPSPVSSHDGTQEKEIIAAVERLITANDAREDAVRLILTDLNAERERTDRLESSLRDVRRCDEETKKDNLRYQAEWQEKFHSLDADIYRWRGTVLNGALCMATSQYHLHMGELSADRSKEEQEISAWENCQRKGIATFDAEEREEQLLLADMVARLDADSEDLKEAVVTHELWLEETEKQEFRANQQYCAIEADLSELGEQSRKSDIAWVTATKEFETEAEGVLCLLDENERAQQQLEGHIENLEAEIESLIAKEQREDIERRLVQILGAAEDSFCKEMSERIEENENNAYCRHEIDVELEQEDQEEALETEECEKGIAEVKSVIDDLEENRCELDEHLGLLDSYIDHLFSLSPSALVADDIPDVSGEETLEYVDECSALYNRTCQLMEQLCVDVSDEEEELEDSASDNSVLQISPENLSVRGSVNGEQETASYDEHDVDSYADTGRIGGLYQRLVQQELEYYNGKTTHDIGVQTGSGPTSLSSSPLHNLPLDSETQYISNAKVPPSEDDQSRVRHGSGSCSPDKRALSLPYSHQQNQDSFVSERPSHIDVDRHQDSNPSSTNGPANASAAQIDLSNVMEAGLSQRTPLVREGSRSPSPGPLDTLAELALQDALDANMFENDLGSGYGAETLEKYLHPSGVGYTPTRDPAEKENVVDTSGLSSNKNGDLKVYGLRLDSPLRVWNSPIGERSAELEPIPSVLDDVAATSAEKDLEQGRQDKQVFNDGMLYNLDDLSVELNAFNIQPHRQSVESVVENPSSANKLVSVMRRISIAASSPQGKLKRPSETAEDRNEPHCDIIRTIFILIRYCSRSNNQLKLRELGTSIICDFCTIQGRVADIIAAEECIDVLTTCLQYHRDQDRIFDPTIRILWEIALHPDGKQLIVDSKDSVARLQNVHELLVSHVVREQKNRARIQQANMIVDIVRKRRAEGGSLKGMTEALRTARDQKLNSEAPLKDSYRLLGDLVEIIS